MKIEFKGFRLNIFIGAFMAWDGVNLIKHYYNFVYEDSTIIFDSWIWTPYKRNKVIGVFKYDNFNKYKFYLVIRKVW